MGSNKRDLRAYVRFDGSGRVVAGSLILRRKKPKVGKWMEIQTYECCDDTTTSTTSSSTTLPPVSDIRLKDNITATGGFVNGLPEYTWVWNATAVSLGLDNNPTKGVLAQEVLEKCPEFVVYDTTIGYFRVKYNELSKA
jgi:hypothetical protein